MRVSNRIIPRSECGVMWHDVVRCGVMWCGVVRCGVMWCDVVRCGDISVFGSIMFDMSKKLEQGWAREKVKAKTIIQDAPRHTACDMWMMGELHTGVWQLRELFDVACVCGLFVDVLCDYVGLLVVWSLMLCWLLVVLLLCWYVGLCLTAPWLRSAEGGATTEDHGRQADLGQLCYWQHVWETENYHVMWWCLQLSNQVIVVWYAPIPTTITWWENGWQQSHHLIDSTFRM